MEITLLQTLKDKDNPQYIEDNGPFKCTNPHAWLGHGYYFWDTHIELAHWWGSSANMGKYIICEARGNIDNTCWDLHGNGKHLVEFKKTCDEIIKARVTTKDKLTVPMVIEFLKSSSKFKYLAIRALGTSSISSSTSNIFTFHVPFEYGNKPYLDIYPPIQVCLIQKNALNLRNYVVIYPDHHVEHYI